MPNQKPSEILRPLHLNERREAIEAILDTHHSRLTALEAKVTPEMVEFLKALAEDCSDMDGLSPRRDTARAFLAFLDKPQVACPHEFTITSGWKCVKCGGSFPPKVEATNAGAGCGVAVPTNLRDPAPQSPVREAGEPCEWPKFTTTDFTVFVYKGVQCVGYYKIDTGKLETYAEPVTFRYPAERDITYLEAISLIPAIAKDYPLATAKGDGPIRYTDTYPDTSRQDLIKALNFHKAQYDILDKEWMAKAADLHNDNVDLRTRIASVEREMDQIDSELGNRAALDGLTRVGKVRAAIQAARKCDSLEAEAGRLRKELAEAKQASVPEGYMLWKGRWFRAIRHADSVPAEGTEVAVCFVCPPPPGAAS